MADNKCWLIMSIFLIWMWWLNFNWLEWLIRIFWSRTKISDNLIDWHVTCQITVRYYLDIFQGASTIYFIFLFSSLSPFGAMWPNVISVFKPQKHSKFCGIFLHTIINNLMFGIKHGDHILFSYLYAYLTN